MPSDRPKWTKAQRLAAGDRICSWCHAHDRGLHHPVRLDFVCDVLNIDIRLGYSACINKERREALHYAVQKADGPIANRTIIWRVDR